VKSEEAKAERIEGSVIKPFLAVTIALTGAAGAKAKADEYGLATYYRNPWHGGLIAAHRTLPFGSHVRVDNLDNGRSTVVTIVDRGPYARGRIIDVSTVAADVLGMRQAGVAHVRLEKL
jgi:rare lipoprotein A